ncbi:c-type cytochrome [Oceaniglobus trochenteri]|uniref:c-type cytochrome n=1 Tax=Oceaniglobus trochenteri TaxID=2763260 RepID=UPI001CFFCC4E|nr:cytochrome c [Oceaniglobus trochenteri]
MKRVALILAGLLALVVILAGVVYVAFTGPGDIPPASRDLANLSREDRAQMEEAGEYVARAGDCVACHKSPDGLALAGGTAMETPVGSIFGSNITPSRDHGIADYSADDLYRAMVYGITPDGGHLYPAMPYTSYHAISRADSDALWVWLMAQDPIERPNRPAELIFPFNLRPLVAFWNLIFRSDPPDQPVAGLTGADTGNDPVARGRYLVEVLGHCGECHTPRNLAYARKPDAHLQGTVIEDALAPDITPGALARRGWNAADLEDFLAEGLSPQGVMTFRMFPVLSHSTKYLSPEDVSAVAAYLTEGAPAPAPPAPNDGALTDNAPGHALYLGLCAGCHGAEGQGQPFGSVPLRGNTSAMFDDPLNLVRIIREGIPARHLTGYQRMQEMPAFADRLNDDELAALVNYLRQRWGGHDRALSEEDVAGASG